MELKITCKNKKQQKELEVREEIQYGTCAALTHSQLRTMTKQSTQPSLSTPPSQSVQASLNREKQEDSSTTTVFVGEKRNLFRIDNRPSCNKKQ